MTSLGIILAHNSLFVPRTHRFESIHNLVLLLIAVVFIDVKKPPGSNGVKANFLASRRFEPSSCSTLMGEQTNPWDLLQPQDVLSRHRGSEPRRRCGRSDATTLLSPG